jgi:predicted nuclease of predicted toxin-antitoxin system
MRVLLDHDVPHSLRSESREDCKVVTAEYRGWADLDDSELLSAAEDEFTVLVTLDTNLAYQQNVQARELGIVVVDVHPIVPDYLKRHMGKVNSALPLAAEEKETAVVREDGISLLSPL